MFAKVINGELQRAPKFFETDDNAVFTNSAETHLQHGYKKVVFSTPPEYDESHYPVSVWNETETEIIQTWKLVPFEDGENE